MPTKVIYRQLGAYALLLCLTLAVTTVIYFNVRGPQIAMAAGERLFEERRYSEAIPHYLQAINKGLYNTKVVFHLGDAYAAEKRFEEASKTYQGYLERYPNDREAMLRLARVLSYQGKLEASSEMYEKAINKKEEGNAVK